jgi:hypothetical protein
VDFADVTFEVVNPHRLKTLCGNQVPETVALAFR